MKTAREWFQCLRPDLRDRAIKNTITDGNGLLGKKYVSFSETLGDAFMWDESPEGYEFWSKINLEAQDIEEGRKPDIK